MFGKQSTVRWIPGNQARFDNLARNWFGKPKNTLSFVIVVEIDDDDDVMERFVKQPAAVDDENDKLYGRQEIIRPINSMRVYPKLSFDWDESKSIVKHDSGN